MMKNLKYFLILAIVMIFFSGSAQAQLKPNSSGGSRGPISISADRMEADDPQGVVTFSDAVVARQGDMTITCDQMKVYYAHNEAAGKTASTGRTGEAGAPFSSGSRQIDRVECEGNVKVVEGERMAVGKKALYLAQAQPRRIVLTGDARVWQGRDSLTGHQVTYYLDSQRSLVEGGKRERVRTTYHQGDE